MLFLCGGTTRGNNHEWNNFGRCRFCGLYRCAAKNKDGIVRCGNACEKNKLFCSLHQRRKGQ
jgi:hypothetical protein